MNIKVKCSLKFWGVMIIKYLEENKITHKKLFC